MEEEVVEEKEVVDKENDNAQTFKEQMKAILQARSPDKIKARKSSDESHSEGPPSKKNKVDHDDDAKGTPGSKSKSSKLSPGSADQKQPSILSFFSKFKPKEATDQCSPKLKSFITLTKKTKTPDKPSSSTTVVEKKEKDTSKGNESIIRSSVGFFKINETKFEKCSKCKEEFENTASLERHMKTSHSTGPSFVCQYGRMTFTNALTWKSHEYSHQSKSLKCEVCDKDFTSDKALEKHRSTNHSSVSEDKEDSQKPMLECDKCDYKCKYAAVMEKHKKAKHSDLKLQVVHDGEEEVIDISSGDESAESVKTTASTESSSDSKKGSVVTNLKKDWDGIQSYF